MTTKNILVTGGAGYVGSILTPLLLLAGHNVRVVDMFYFGDTLGERATHGQNLKIIRGDFRNIDLMERTLDGIDAVIHLACLSNDPCAELSPALTESEYHALEPMLQAACKAGAQRFIYASSSSVYGTKPDHVDVVETLPLEPITTYSKYKARSEETVMRYQGMLDAIVFRPATVCGYSPRLRLDVVVNALTAQAYFNHEIRVEGGRQYRAHLHIADMARCYVEALTWGQFACGQVYNVSARNMTVMELAQLVIARAGGKIAVVDNAGDPRSYRLNSDKLHQLTGFEPRHSVNDAILDLVTVFQNGLVPNAMVDSRYYNIRRMKEILEK